MGDKAREVTVTGCLTKGSDDHFTVTNARLEPATTATAGTTTTTGKGTTTAGTTTAGTTTATTTTGTAGKSDAAMRKGFESASWVVVNGTDLDRHVGHRIAVTGRLLPESRPTTVETTTEHTAIPRLDFQSMKMASSSCQ